MKGLAAVEKRFASVPFPKLLGMRVEASRRGAALARAVLKPVHTQLFGVAHGGWVATLADTAQTAAAYTVLPPDTEILTTDFSLRFLRTLRRGAAVAEARVLKAGRRVVVTEATVRDAGRRVVAHGTFANLVL